MVFTFHCYSVSFLLSPASLFFFFLEWQSTEAWRKTDETGKLGNLKVNFKLYFLNCKKKGGMSIKTMNMLIK